MLEKRASKAQKRKPHEIYFENFVDNIGVSDASLPVK